MKTKKKNSVPRSGDSASGAVDSRARPPRPEVEESPRHGERSGLLDGIPTDGPALLQAQRIGEKAAEVGFDWPDIAGVRAKLDEEIAELDEAIAIGDHAAVAEELGDVLFTLTRLGSKLAVPPEDALRACMRRFRGRFAAIEALARASGKALGELSLAEMDAMWRRVKAVAGERAAGFNQNE